MYFAFISLYSSFFSPEAIMSNHFFFSGKYIVFCFKRRLYSQARSPFLSCGLADTNSMKSWSDISNNFRMSCSVKDV